MDEDIVRATARAHLAHLLHCSSLDPDLPKITLKSDGIFLGLGVPSECKRNSLLCKANNFGYLDGWEPEALSQMLVEGSVFGSARTSKR